MSQYVIANQEKTMTSKSIIGKLQTAIEKELRDAQTEAIQRRLAGDTPPSAPGAAGAGVMDDNEDGSKR